MFKFFERFFNPETEYEKRERALMRKVAEKLNEVSNASAIVRMETDKMSRIYVTDFLWLEFDESASLWRLLKADSDSWTPSEPKWIKIVPFFYEYLVKKVEDALCLQEWREVSVSAK